MPPADTDLYAPVVPRIDHANASAASDLAAIEATVWTYLDGLYEGDVEKLALAFHPVAHLYSDDDGAVVDQPRERWFEAVRKRPSPASQGHTRHDRIVSIDCAGPATAMVKCECAVPPRYFVDYLTLIRTRQGWRVVAKAFRTEIRGD